MNYCSQTDEKTYGQQSIYTHENPTHPMASDSMSPRIEGKELPAGK